jgi:hypothetical protein
VASEQLISANGKAVAECRAAVAKATKAQRCMLMVPALCRTEIIIENQ